MYSIGFHPHMGKYEREQKRDDCVWYDWGMIFVMINTSKLTVTYSIVNTVLFYYSIIGSDQFKYSLVPFLSHPPGPVSQFPPMWPR